MLNNSLFLYLVSLCADYIINHSKNIEWKCLEKIYSFLNCVLY